MKRLIVLLATLLLSFGLSYGNEVDFTVDNGEPAHDTIRVGVNSTIDVSIQNDAVLTGIGLGWRIWSDDGVGWTWDFQTEGWGPLGYQTGLQCFTSHGRMTPSDDVFDMTGGILVTEQDVDGISPDTIMFGGVVLFGTGIVAGSAEVMGKFHFTAEYPAITEQDVKTLCIDSTFVPPAGNFVFVDDIGGTYAPPVAWDPGGKCFPVTKARNFCPAWDGPSASMDVSHVGSNTVSNSVTDSESNAPSFSYVLTGGTGTVALTPSGNSVDVTYFGTAADVGTAVSIEVKVWDAFHAEGDCASWTINVTVTNNAPTIDCGESVSEGFGTTIMKTDIVGSDVDDDALTYAMVSGPGDIDANTGVWTWTTDIGDVGDYVVEVSVTDGLSDAVTCTFDVSVKLTEAYGVVIDKMHCVRQGHFVDLPILLTKGSTAMGGFDFLLAYDNSLLSFTEASMGTYFQGCGWEYFTYRHGSHGNCGTGCPSGEIRLVGIAETNNGPFHPDFDCIGTASATDEVIANLTFFVTTDVNANDMFAQVNFFWMDCADNTISTMSGDTLAMSDTVFSYVGYVDNDCLLLGLDECECIVDTYTPLDPDGWFFYDQFGYPGLYGAPPICFETGQYDKDAPIRFINFYNGGIDIVNKDKIDDRGDINMNGLPNEIADAVMFTNYFISGLGAFGSHIDGSIAASDINADGTALTVADLVYLVRVIIGDAVPYATKPAPGTLFGVTTQMVGANMNVGVETTVDAGAALFVFNVAGDAGTPVLYNNMDVVSNIENGELRVLVYNIGTEAISSGDLMTIPVNGSIELISVEAADYNGGMMESAIRALPTAFSVDQNYPNPFNPTTVMGFNLNVASDWSIDIYNIAGQRVNSFTGYNEAGSVSVEWDATDASGKSVASGIYFYKVTAGENSATMKMVLTK